MPGRAPKSSIIESSFCGKKIEINRASVTKAKLQFYAITAVIAYALALGELKHLGWSKVLAKPLFELPGYTTAH